jgi:hypothetical protein
MRTILDKPTIPDILPLLRDYVRDNPVGGSLHVVLDDGNIENSSIETCLNTAKELNDERAIVLANLLLKMSRTQRKKLCHLYVGMERNW